MAIKRQINRVLPTQTLQLAADMMRVLAHPARLRLLEMIAVDDYPVGDLAKHLRLAQHVVSAHLMLMRSHGILRRRRAGRKVYYEPASDQALALLHVIQTYADRYASFRDGEAI